MGESRPLNSGLRRWNLGPCALGGAQVDLGFAFKQHFVRSWTGSVAPSPGSSHNIPHAAPPRASTSGQEHEGAAEEASLSPSPGKRGLLQVSRRQEDPSQALYPAACCVPDAGVLTANASYLPLSQEGCPWLTGAILPEEAWESLYISEEGPLAAD